MKKEKDASIDFRKEFLQAFQRLSPKYGNHGIWQDFVVMSACALATLDCERADKREKMYLETVAKYEAGEIELLCSLFCLTVEALEENPDQDFLGSLYTKLNLCNNKAGQFFTPYSIAKPMAELTIDEDDLVNQINSNESTFISVSDPAVGTGVTLMAFANYCRERNINYQKHVLFIGQDIDYFAALTTFIQLSLLGCPGYVVVGDSLADPITTNREGREIWYTPMYHIGNWAYKEAL